MEKKKKNKGTLLNLEHGCLSVLFTISKLLPDGLYSSWKWISIITDDESSYQKFPLHIGK